MACSARGPGPTSSIWVQNDPSHSHVSPNIASPVPNPPNNTVRPRWESKVIAWFVRALGPKFDLCVHKNLATISHLPLKPPYTFFTCLSGGPNNLVNVYSTLGPH